MLRAIALVVFLVVTAASVSVGAKMEVAAHYKDNRNVFTLYRNSPAFADMRIHVASFDAHERAKYNRTNCEIARKLFAGQHGGIKVQYWCEPGRYRR